MKNYSLLEIFTFIFMIVGIGSFIPAIFLFSELLVLVGTSSFAICFLLFLLGFAEEFNPDLKE